MSKIKSGCGNLFSTCPQTPHECTPLLPERVTLSRPVIGCRDDYRGSDWLRNEAGNRKLKKKKILSTKVHVSLCLTSSRVVRANLTIGQLLSFGRHRTTKMGCFFSKKSKRKSSEKEDRTPTTTTVETTTSNAVPLGNNTDEPPKQYSWDKREKVT